jgi:ectoine hydroxylase-related dioxygenase (phytanoyl-CoA dioxygenase family)
MHDEYVAQFGKLDLAAMRDRAAKPPPNRLLEVGGGRYDITLRMTGAFGRTEVFANGLLLQFLRPLLGRDMHLSNFTAVVSHPGAPQQRSHRDSAHLFSEPGVGPGLPVYAVNVAVPLIDVDLETGPTGVWLGSHRLGQTGVVLGRDMTVCPLLRGDCMALDYRTMHAGLVNRSGQARPIVYMVYARPWFFDNANHIKRIPLDMPLERYYELPETVQPLLTRAFSYAVRARWHVVDVQTG